MKKKNRRKCSDKRDRSEQRGRRKRIRNDGEGKKYDAVSGQSDKVSSDLTHDETNVIPTSVGN